jgi:hypothetical protein
VSWGRFRRASARAGDASGRTVRPDPLLQLAGFLVFTHRAQVEGKVVSRGQGMGVVVAQHPEVARHGVLVECTGPLVVTQCAQVDGTVVNDGQ